MMLHIEYAYEKYNIRIYINIRCFYFSSVFFNNYRKEKNIVKERMYGLFALSLLSLVCFL